MRCSMERIDHMQYLPDMEVLEPEDFREEVKRDIAQMYRNYGL